MGMQANLTIAVVVVAVAAGYLSGWGGKILGEAEEMAWYRQGLEAGGNLIFTKERLRYFNGLVDGRPMVLCVVGRCYDVSEGQQFYFGADQEYNCFIGRDNSRAFVTGNFSIEAATDDISDFQEGEWGGIGHWVNFYSAHETYKPVGVVVGRYFDEEGKGTAELEAVLKAVKDQKLAEEEDKKQYPPCNSRYSPEDGSVFWCANDSGGVERGWVGHPRKRDNLCVCVKGDRLAAAASDKSISEFDGCDPSAVQCRAI